MEKTNLYILTGSEAGLKDEGFEPAEHEDRGGLINMQYFAWFRRACERRGITVHTFDFWSREKSTPNDVLFVQNHPGETFIWRLFYFLKNFRTRGGFILARRKFLLENYKYFKRRVLWHVESPVTTPYVYEHMDRISLSGIYQKIILLACSPSGSYKHIDWYSLREYPLTSIYFHEPKNKFLTMISSNKAPHTLKEVYGERLRAIRYFSGKNVFDFYGHGWDRRPQHPFYFHYKKYVDKVWRGVVEDKMKTLSGYKFSLCFENCSYPGYISEKIYDSLAAGCIPVYLGAPDITSVVPASCFIDFKKFKNYDELYRFLSTMSGEELARRRAEILRFLSDDSTMKGMGYLLDEALS